MEKGDSVLSDGGFLKRGDAPAQAVIHANAQAMALRKAAETQEELGKINERVEKVIQEISKNYSELGWAYKYLKDSVME